MDYIDYIKKHDNLDKYILFLLSIGVSVSQTARWTKTSRMHIYNVLDRLQSSGEEYGKVIAELQKQIPR